MNMLAKSASAFLSVLVILAPVFSQQQSAMTAETITENIYMIKGGIANGGFVIGEKDVAVIDAGMTANDAKGMIDAVGKVTPKPITKVILTHSDADHVNGLSGFPKEVEVIASAGARKEMEEAFKSPSAQELRPFLPAKTFTMRMDLDLGTERAQLLHFGPAHTSGDAVVFFPARKVVFVGDLVFIGMDPLIHRVKGGNSTGLIRTLQELLKLDADRYISGHSSIVGKSDIERLMKSLQEKQDKVTALVREGKSLQEVKQAFGIPASPSKPGSGFPSIVEVMYLELSGK